MPGQSTLGDEEDDELLHPEREAQPGRIARPNASSSLPGASLRGLPPPVPSASSSAPTAAAPAPGSTEDLENLAEASHLAPRPVAKPSALESRLSGDQSELVREQRTGSGISQIQHGSPDGGIGIAKPHPVVGGILRGLSTLGSVISPTIMSRIPGTEEHHDKLLTQQQGRIGEDLGEQKDQATNEETQARTDQATAAAEKDRALAAEAGKVKPKEESWKDFPQFTDVDGTPLKIEANSGQTLRVDGKPATGYKAAKIAPDKPDNPEQQFVDEYQKAHPGASVADAQHAFKKNETVTEPGNFMPLYNSKGEVTGAWDPKSGRVVKPPDAAGTTTGGHAIADKAATAVTKEAQPYQQMVDNATEAHQLADMATKGNASADVDLVLSFFKMMKGTGGAGVRFTKQEQDLILGARSAGQGLVAIGQKVIGEGQPLTPEQRQHMVDVMDLHAKAAQQHLDSMKGGESKGGGAIAQPKGATVKVPGADGHLHWSDGKQDLGIAE